MIETLIVNQSEVPRLLPVKECVDVMARAFAALARGEAEMPLRQILWLPEKTGALGLMPAYLTGMAALGLKAVTFFPRNEGTDLDSHQGAVLLFEAGADASSRSSTPPPSPPCARPPSAAWPRGCSPGRTPATSRSSAPGSRRARTSRRCSRCASSGGSASRARPSPARRASPTGRASATRSAIDALRLGRGGGLRRGHRLHRDVLPRAGPPRRVALPRRARQRRRRRASRRRASSTRRPSSRSRLFVDRRESALKEAGDFLIARGEGAVDRRPHPRRDSARS